MRRSQLKRPAAAGANASKRPPSTIGFTSASALPRVPEEASAPTAEAIAAPAAAPTDFSQASFTLFGGPSGPGLGLGAFGDDSKRSDC